MMKFLAPCALVLLGLSACETTAPTADGDDPVPVAGAFEPSDGSFSLKTLSQNGADGRPARVALIGRNLQIDASSSTVSIDVAIHNLSDHSLFPQLLVWLDDFRPVEVTPTNADLLPPALLDIPANGPWGYRYDDFIGEDDELSPDETSEFRTWSFYDPDLAAFRFSARIDFAPQADAARLAGVIFNDADLDGEFDEGEMLFGAGHVFVDGPGGASSVLEVSGDGHYGMYISEPGLYVARYISPPTFGFAPVYMTTPNPLEILIPSGPDGRPRDFLHADFGIAPGDPFPRPVQFSDLPPAEIPSDPFQFLGMGVLDRLLVVEMGFSGCSPGHPVKLVMAGDFEFDASGAPTAHLVVVHDDLEELCDAWFQVRRPFDLMPLVFRYHDQTGRIEAIRLAVHMADGSVKDIVFTPPDPSRL